jgi:hypothetical protein
MDGVLSGFGLAGAAGLNAYIPLLILGIASRLGYADLQAPYDLLGSNAGLGILALLLLVEVLADKVPGIDHVNDLINTAVRPTAGGVLALANSGAGTLHPALLLLLGIVTAGSVHAAKATARPLVTATTVGFGNPIVSTIEDVASIGMALLALIAPVVVAIFLLFGVFAAFLLIRRLRARRARATPRRSGTA